MVYRSACGTGERGALQYRYAVCHHVRSTTHAPTVLPTQTSQHVTLLAYILSAGVRVWRRLCGVGPWGSAQVVMRGALIDGGVRRRNSSGGPPLGETRKQLLCASAFHGT